ncbi:hypothetical protein B0H19DRAFT_1086274 [Mycena capillaripes]|nr:hypothetical protein B0H19DRAFT_1086274 [Mycena capillaripes]
MWQAIVRIDVAIQKRALNEAILASHKRARMAMGGSICLDSCADLDGGVITQLYVLLEAAKEQRMPESYVHFFGDTTPPPLRDTTATCSRSWRSCRMASSRWR